jgi:hypothetical protein
MNPEEVDIRLAAGTPTGPTTPIKMICPMHKERLGMEDDTGSLAVYRHNIHCFGCGFHIRRRYAALAFLLGAWDGRGDEDSMRVRDAIREYVKPRLGEFIHGRDPVGTGFAPPAPSPYEVEAFCQYLFRYKEDRLVDALMTERGLTIETIRRFKIGHTGTHFTIPVYGLGGDIYSIRYRTDELALDAGGASARKYEGTFGRNAPCLYPLPTVGQLSEVGSLWITEGEFDALAAWQHGLIALTVTNGAGAVAKVVEMVGREMPGLNVSRWVVATDQDAAGEEAAQKILAALLVSGQAGVRARWGWGKDLGEYFSTGGSVRRISFERSSHEEADDGRDAPGAGKAV